MSNREDGIRDCDHERAVAELPDGMRFLGEVEIRAGELFVWTQPDGGRFFGFMPTPRN